MLFENDLINLEMKFNNQEEALTFLASKLYEKNYVSNEYKDKIIEREENFPTAVLVGNIGVALPHTDVKYVKENKISLMTLIEPICFKDMVSKEDVLVKVVFMLSLNDTSYHLDMLKRLILLIQNQNLMDELINTKSKTKVLELLHSINLR